MVSPDEIKGSNLVASPDIFLPSNDSLLMDSVVDNERKLSGPVPVQQKNTREFRPPILTRLNLKEKKWISLSENKSKDLLKMIPISKINIAKFKSLFQCSTAFGIVLMFPR